MAGRRDDTAPRSLSGKTLDVLGAFDADAARLTLSELSRRSGVALTTVHRITQELVAWRALERTADGRYQIGLRLFELASLAPRALPLRELALPLMEDLYEATHENVQLAVREGHSVVYLERLTGKDAVGVRTRVGGRFALHATGVGLVLLAHAPREVQDDVLAAPLLSWTPRTVTDPGRLRAMLADVRTRGVAISDRQVTMDAVSVACPVRGPGDQVVAALSLVVHASGTPRAEAFVPALRAASRTLSRALGAPGDRRRPSDVRRLTAAAPPSQQRPDG